MKSDECKVTFFHPNDKMALCRLVGIAQGTEFGDPVLWLRVIDRFMLTQCEERCRFGGKDEWIRAVHEQGPISGNVEQMGHFLTLFTLKPESKLDTNVFLHPQERQSAVQCLAFLMHPNRVQNAGLEECEIRRMLEYLVATRSDSLAIANTTNFRRLRGDFGENGQYPTNPTPLSRSNPTQMAERSTALRL